MAGGHDRLDVAADVEIPDHLDLPGVQELDEVVQYPVGDVLVEDMLVAKAVDVELEGLQFHAPLVGNVFNVDGREIGETTAWTNAGEFGTMKFHGVFALTSAVGESLQLIVFNGDFTVKAILGHG